MANEEHYKILIQGPDVWNAWRANHPGVRPDLSGADLFGANLSGANLEGAKLEGANLRWADLTGSKLEGAKVAPGWKIVKA